MDETTIFKLWLFLPTYSQMLPLVYKNKLTGRFVPIIAYPPMISNPPRLGPLLLIIVLIGTSHSILAEDIVLPSGVVLKDAKVSRVEPDGLRLMHAEGVTKVPFEALPPELQSKYSFDPVAANAFRMETNKKLDDAASKRREEREAKERRYLAESRARENLIAKTPRLTKSSSVKTYWLSNLPWPKSMEPGQVKKTKFCKYMTQEIQAGVYDLEAESTALQWNINEYGRVGDRVGLLAATKSLDQVRAAIVKRDAEEEAARLRMRELAIQEAGVAAQKKIASSLQDIAFQALAGGNVYVTFW